MCTADTAHQSDLVSSLTQVSRELGGEDAVLLLTHHTRDASHTSRIPLRALDPLDPPEPVLACPWAGGCQWCPCRACRASSPRSHSCLRVCVAAMARQTARTLLVRDSACLPRRCPCAGVAVMRWCSTAWPSPLGCKARRTMYKQIMHTLCTQKHAAHCKVRRATFQIPTTSTTSKTVRQHRRSSRTFNGTSTVSCPRAGTRNEPKKKHYNSWTTCCSLTLCPSRKGGHTTHQDNGHLCRSTRQR